MNRLIRISYGPFQLLELRPGEVDSVKRRVIADQLKPEVARELGLAETAEDHRAKWKDKKAAAKPETKSAPVSKTKPEPEFELGPGAVIEAPRSRVSR